MPTFDEAFVQARYERWAKAVDPDFAEIMSKITFRGLYRRDVLDQKTREFITIAALTVTNALPQLGVHIEAAFRAGATPAEVKEVIVQMTTYGGVPYVNSAFDVYEQVAKRLGKDA